MCRKGSDIMNYTMWIVFFVFFYIIVDIIILCATPNKRKQRLPNYPQQQYAQSHFYPYPEPQLQTSGYNQSSSKNLLALDLLYNDSFTGLTESESQIMAPPGVPDGFDELYSATTADDDDIEKDPENILVAQEQARLLQENEDNYLMADYLMTSYHQ